MWGKTSFNQISNDYILNHKQHNFNQTNSYRNPQRRA